MTLRALFVSGFALVRTFDTLLCGGMSCVCSAGRFSASRQQRSWGRWPRWLALLVCHTDLEPQVLLWTPSGSEIAVGLVARLRSWRFSDSLSLGRTELPFQKGTEYCTLGMVFLVIFASVFMTLPRVLLCGLL